MASTKVQPSAQTEPKSTIPDYLANPDAVIKDSSARWRYGKAPDYSKTRQVYAETKHMNHKAGSLEDMVENLVKNWEVEASFKSQLSDWRTVDHEKYTFAINGGPPQSAEHMLKVGTYNAIIAPSEYYSPNYSDFASSHKTFKRMMPTFAWEVLEVYSGPPRVAFKWRHWGTMKNDYIGFNDKGENVTAKAHGGPIDITGITIATVDDKVRLQDVNTYFDPLEMFRQIAPHGIVNKTVIDRKDTHTDKQASASCPFSGASTNTASGCPMMSSMGFTNLPAVSASQKPTSTHNIYASSITGHPEDRITASNNTDHSQAADAHDRVDEFLESVGEKLHLYPHTMEQHVHPEAGEAVAVTSDDEETMLTHQEMSSITTDEEPLLMNRE